jgi:flagellar motor switch protein FliN/FliY
MASTGIQPWLLAELAHQFSAVVSAMTGADAPVEAGNQPPPGAGDAEADRINWIQGFDLAEDAGAALGAPAETWRAIGARPLAAAGLTPEEIDDESSRSTFLEILNQAMSAVASSAGAKAGRQVLPANGRQAGAWPEEYPAATYTITLAGGEPLVFYLGVTGGWDAALTPPPARSLTMAAEAGASAGATEPRAILAQNSRTFDLLLDVELPVSISFGRAMIPLREVVKLTSGSVVELNRTVSEPVELIVNNCVIARGEVVVIEGNYGVRIQQIISPQERLRTLH